MHAATNTFSDRSHEAIFKDVICKRYTLNYVEQIELRSSIITRCITEQNARELERKFNRGSITSIQGLIGKALEIPFTSKDTFVNLIFSDSTQGKT